MLVNSNYKNTQAPAFKAVNKAYLESAKQNYKINNTVTSDWYESIADAVLDKEISYDDAFDTMNKVKQKYVKTPNEHKMHNIVHNALKDYKKLQKIVESSLKDIVIALKENYDNRNII